MKKFLTHEIILNIPPLSKREVFLQNTPATQGISSRMFCEWLEPTVNKSTSICFFGLISQIIG